MNEQEKYKKYVTDYFKDVGVSLPNDMGIWITSDADETDRYEAVRAIKDDKGEWTEAGFMQGADCYFMGNYRIGYLIPQVALVFYSGDAGFPRHDRDNIQYIAPIKSWMIKHALFVTYFRVIKPWGSGAPMLKVEQK